MPSDALAITQRESLVPAREKFTEPDIDDAEKDWRSVTHPRDKAIISIVKTYRTHRYVVRAVSMHATREIKYSDDVLAHYRHLAESYPLLDKADEQELFGYIDAGVQIYEQLDPNQPLSPAQELAMLKLVAAYELIEHSNLRLVMHFASKHGFELPLIERIQEGHVGLLVAIRRFDVTRGNKFSTFAAWWIRQAVARGAAEQARTVRLPVYIYDQVIKFRAATNRLYEQLQDVPTDDEIAHYMGISLAELHEIEAWGKNPYSLDTPVDESSETPVGDFIADQKVAQAVDEAMTMQTYRHAIVEVLGQSGLTDRMRFIIGLRFGLEPDLIGNPTISIKPKEGNDLKYLSYARTKAQLKPHEETEALATLDDIGNILGVTRERVRQIEAKAFQKIREAIDPSVRHLLDDLDIS